MNRTPTPRKLPVTIISGFLGAGKTTLVNQLLQQRAPGSIGVVVNEFGEVGIDGQLIVAEEQALVEINNGCVCCTVRADLVGSVKALLARPQTGAAPMQRLIVETSGLADPAPVLQTFLADPDLREAVDLESVVTVVDALHLRRQLDDDIAREQVAFADVILINKLDLITADELIAIERTIRSLNPTAAIITSTRSKIRADALLDVRRFSLPTLLAIEPDLLDEGAHDHEHDTSIQSCALVEKGDLDATRFNRWINELVQQQGQQLMRMKGVLNFHAEARQFHFHSVHMLLEAEPGRAWQKDEPRENKFVFIGRNLDFPQLRESFLSCIH
ncbi:GTP-binding protein [Paraburkholderia sp. RP-4-7]|uniref:GTP-binding protein n=1 Tax=Paraburkholderia polaris TaxID=2728848 RepID=A0A848IRF9_9BURK|nr:GTP-binding protein [Paraburkholderia polaris]NMM01727.1 GTP-binding protein [Paraburkholderia polaris]